MLNFLGTNSLLRFQVTNRPWFFGLLFCVLFLIVSSTLLVLGGSDENPKPIETTTPIEPAPQTLEEEPVFVPSRSGDAEEATRVQELECLALNVYHESRSDNFAGRVAVADVVLNRVDSNLFPNTICGVVNQSVMRTNWKGNVVPVRGMCHFSWFCDGLSDEPMETDSYEDAEIVAEMALRGGWRGITEGATHYHATYVTPNWINDRGMVPVGRIGQHKFYRWH